MTIRTAIRVISMADAAARRAQFTASASDATVAWEFIDASRGVEPPLTYDPARAVRRFGRPLKPGELGCYASHVRCWQWLVASDHDQMIIMEDDIVVDWRAIATLAANDMQAIDIGLLRLFLTHPTQTRVARYKFLSDHAHLMEIQGRGMGTQAYLVTRRAAAVLLANALQVDAPVDWVLSRYWEHGFRHYCLFPSPLIERLGTSTIAHHQDNALAESFQANLMRKGWTIADRIRREIAQRRLPRPAAFDRPDDSGSEPFIKLPA